MTTSTVRPLVHTTPAAPGHHPAPAPAPGSSASRALRTAGLAWLVVAVAGQAVFAAYVLLFYGRAGAQGDPQRWNRVLTGGWVPGDAFGNLMVVLHLMLTVIVVAGGAAQLLPALRRHAPAVHRWNGRVYVVSAIVLSLTGLVMIWTRGTVGNVWQHLGTSVNGVVIMACALQAWRAARTRQFDAHRRWALRLYLAVSGVWFFRVALMAWLLVHRAPVGFDAQTFTGPFLVFLAFAQFTLPLLLLELFLRAQAGSRTAGQWIMAAVMGAVTLLTLLGIGGAMAMMWLPHMV